MTNEPQTMSEGANAVTDNKLEPVGHLTFEGVDLFDRAPTREEDIERGIEMGIGIRLAIAMLKFDDKELTTRVATDPDTLMTEVENIGRHCRNLEHYLQIFNSAEARLSRTASASSAMRSEISSVFACNSALA